LLPSSSKTSRFVLSFAIKNRFTWWKLALTQQETFVMTFQFDVIAEQMIHISRFQLLLRIKERHLPFHLDQLQISTKEIKKCCSLVEIYSEGMGIVFSAVFPRSLTNVVLQSLDEISLQLSLPYEEDLTTGELGTAKPLTPIEMINEIQCNSCQQRLLPCKSIQRTCELPVGHWDEIADYLICYNGVSNRMMICLAAIMKLMVVVVCN
jgi:hypothetical protein